jgi:hypothetical protein
VRYVKGGSEKGGLAISLSAAPFAHLADFFRLSKPGDRDRRERNTAPRVILSNRSPATASCPSVPAAPEWTDTTTRHKIGFMAVESEVARNDAVAAAPARSRRLRRWVDGLRDEQSIVRRFLAWGAIGAVYVLLRANIVDIPLSRDEGLFAYIGQIVQGGGLPYRDVVDHKPPLVYYLFALIAHLPRTATSVHIFLHAYNFLTLLACSSLAGIVSGSRSAGRWTALAYAVMSSLPSVQGCTASTEMFLLLPATLGLLFAVLATKQRRLRWPFLSGAMGAFAVLTKQTGALLALFSAIIVCVSAYRADGALGQKIRATFFRALAWLLGFLVPVAFVAAYFFHRGGLADLVYWVVTYNIDYAAQPYAFGIYHGFAHVFEALCVDSLPLIVVAFATPLLLLLGGSPLGPFVLGFFGFSLLGTIPFVYPHYVAHLVPAGALAAGIGLANLHAWLPRGSARRILCVSACALIVGFPLFSRPRYYVTGTPEALSRRIYGKRNPFPEAKPVADFVAARTTPDDHVFVLGSEAEILFQAGRKSPSRFVLKYPLTLSWSKRRHDLQRNAIARLKANPPKYILVVRSFPSLVWDGKTSFPLHDQVESLIESSYILEALQPITSPQTDIIYGEAVKSALSIWDRSTKDSILIYRRI